MNNWKKFQKQSQKGWDKTKQFFTLLFNKTVEESKIVSARASEAGRLTALNTQRYRVQREVNDHFHELGARVYTLIKGGKGDFPQDPTISEEVSNIKNCETQLAEIDRQIGTLRKTTDVEVKKIHEFHQKESTEAHPQKRVSGRKL